VSGVQTATRRDFDHCLRMDGSAASSSSPRSVLKEDTRACVARCVNCTVDIVAAFLALVLAWLFTVSVVLPRAGNSDAAWLGCLTTALYVAPFAFVIVEVPLVALRVHLWFWRNRQTVGRWLVGGSPLPLKTD